ncbi:MAG TPA: hypothetical protein VGS41_04540 [Chthonomonadales bacterium]|nr:hypothetical protein [Chthonomonadales bacterium]
MRMVHRVAAAAATAALFAALIAGCKSNGFNSTEVNQMRGKTAPGIPANAYAGIQAKAAEGQRLYLEHLKATGKTPNATNMPPGMAPPPPSSAPPAKH